MSPYGLFSLSLHPASGCRMRSARYAFALSASLLTFCPTPVRLQSASNQTVTAIDERITYEGDWTVQENGGHVFTSVAGSFTLDFAGSAVYWYSRKLYNGAVAAIFFDNDDAVYIDLSNGIGQNDTPVVAVLFDKEGLDVSQTHRLNVTWNGPGSNGVGTFLENYRVQFTGNASTSSTSTSTSSPDSISTSSASPTAASTSSKSNVGAIAGGTVGGILGVLTIVSVFLCLRRRRSRISDRQNMQSATPFVMVQSPTAGPPMHSISPHSSKQPLDNQLRFTNQNEGSRSYSLINSTSAVAQLSPGMAVPLGSVPIRETNTSSRFSFLRSWNRPCTDSASRTQGSLNRNAQTMLGSAGVAVMGRDHVSACEPMATSRTISPYLPGEADHSIVLEEPPPVYRN